MVPRHLAGAPSMSQQDALRRHPAGRAMDPGFDLEETPAARPADAVTGRPIGPDDDPEFLLELDRWLHGGREPGFGA
jgi:hypothetical protein